MVATAPRGTLLRWLLVPLVVVPIGWLLFTGLGNDPRAVDSPLVGRPLPSFSATTMEGGSLSSDQLIGKVSLINVWASWCAPCVDEHPVLLDVAERHAGDLAVVGILYQDSAEGARTFLDRYGDGGWPTILDPEGQIAVNLGVTGPPETFFVDAAGIVRGRHIGPLTADLLATELAALGLAP